jgi:FMN phosphatase YigB (HAD superfamily)
MIKAKQKKYDALLVDLDGTLLNIDLEKFVIAYVNALSSRFTGLVEKEDFIRHLFTATAMMVQNNDPAINNETAFYEVFCPLIGLPLEKIEPIIDHFYENDFPALSCWGSEQPAAKAVVETARAKNIPLVLATNPIFPATATLQRLGWSGLKAEDFQLITTMEIMHFCKPKPQYYLEVAEKIGCDPERCLMAGNDTLEDLVAAEAGMDTFLVDDFILHREGTKYSFDYRGSLEDYLSLLKMLD